MEEVERGRKRTEPLSISPPNATRAFFIETSHHHTTHGRDRHLYPRCHHVKLHFCLAPFRAHGSSSIGLCADPQTSHALVTASLAPPPRLPSPGSKTALGRHRSNSSPHSQPAPASPSLGRPPTLYIIAASTASFSHPALRARAPPATSPVGSDLIHHRPWYDLPLSHPANPPVLLLSHLLARSPR